MENELFAQFVLLSGLKIYFFWQKYTSQTKYFFGPLSNRSPWINLIPRSVSELNSPTSIHNEGQVTGGDRGRLQRHEERAEADRGEDQRAPAGSQRAQDRD